MPDSQSTLFQIDAFPLSKAHVLLSGFVRFVAPIARATKPGEKGYLNLDRKTGKFYRQRIQTDVLEKSKGSFLTVPVTYGHPLQPVTARNGKELARGLTGSSKDSIIQIDSYQFATGTIFDEELIQFIRSRKAREISPGYGVVLSPLQRDDNSEELVCEQLTRRGNHIAFVEKGRQGESVSLQLDSSDFSWDVCMASQYDDAEIEQIKREIDGLPQSFLDLTYTEDSINLDRIQPVLLSNKDTGTKNMATLQLVTHDNRVITVESDNQTQLDALQGYIDTLRKDKDSAVVSANTATQQKDEALTQVEQQKTRITELETAQTQQQGKQQADSATSESQVQALAQKLALDFFAVVPKILKVKNDYQVDGIKTLPELHRDFLMYACPSRVAEFQAMQLDESTPEGVRNAAKLAGMYEVLSQQQSQEQPATQQKDSAVNSEFSRAFQSLLTSASPVPTQQTLLAQHDAAVGAWEKEVDSRF